MKPTWKVYKDYPSMNFAGTYWVLQDFSFHQLGNPLTETIKNYKQSLQFVCRLWHIVHKSQLSASQSGRMHAFSRLSVDGGYIPSTYALSTKSWTRQCIEKPLSAAAFLGSGYWDKDPSIGVFNLKPDILEIICFGAI